MARLRRSNVYGPGITRQRRGRGFLYREPSGERVADREILDRISALAVPPAWQDVWICPWPNGHIQAIGTDAAGRRQYRYHDVWRQQRDKEKFTHIIAFGRALPKLRRAVTADLGKRGLGRQRALALAVRLLDIGCFRVGNVEYAEEHETFGVATLRVEHVAVGRDHVDFCYAAKGSIERALTVTDPEVRRAISSLTRRREPTDTLLSWKRGTTWVDVDAKDVNDYIKAHAGVGFSAKDFRTWSATVLAAVELARREEEAGASAQKQRRAIGSAIKEVADHLGNTPAVCRSSYIDPRIIESFETGETIAPALKKIPKSADRYRVQRTVETVVVALLSEFEMAAAG
jgi:DNA topoisomerase-1